MKTLKKALAVAITTMAISAPATAGIFTYDVNLGKGLGQASLVIDSTAATATYAGANIDLTVTSSDLLGFTGEEPTETVFVADDIAGSFTSYGTTYDAVLYEPRASTFSFEGGNASIWTAVTDSLGNGSGFDFAGTTTFVSVTTPEPAAAPGGGSVPVPATALFILAGLAGIGGAMRRKKAAE